MERVMELVGTLILDEVQRKTCVSLPSDMKEYLGWMLQVDRQEETDVARFAISRCFATVRRFYLLPTKC